jgi:hypothetical protein
MLGVRYKNKKIDKLVFVEVKSTERAMKDKKSGLIKHIKGMEDYIKESTVELKNRLIEAEQILNQYKDLELRKINNITKLENISIEVLVILTNGAIDYFTRNNNYYSNRKNGDDKNLSKILESKGYTIDLCNKDRVLISKTVKE